jgi:hypothetical protein
LNTSDEPYEFLDVSDYAAPEPLQMALEAIQRITSGRFLYLQHRRYPRLLYDRLRERGFESDTRRGESGQCKVFIWQQKDELARQRVMAIASRYSTWQV